MASLAEGAAIFGMNDWFRDGAQALRRANESRSKAPRVELVPISLSNCSGVALKPGPPNHPSAF